MALTSRHKIRQTSPLPLFGTENLSAWAARRSENENKPISVIFAVEEKIVVTENLERSHARVDRVRCDRIKYALAPPARAPSTLRTCARVNDPKALVPPHC